MVPHSILCPAPATSWAFTLGLKAMGVKVETNTVVGRTITIDELMEENGFEAVFVGSGAGLPIRRFC